MAGKALHFAAKGGHSSTIELLVNEFHGNLHECSSLLDGSRTPLHIATELDHEDAIVTLIALGARSSQTTGFLAKQQLNTPVFIAIAEGNLRALKALSEQGANLMQTGFWMLNS